MRPSSTEIKSDVKKEEVGQCNVKKHVHSLHVFGNT